MQIARESIRPKVFTVQLFNHEQNVALADIKSNVKFWVNQFSILFFPSLQTSATVNSNEKKNEVNYYTHWRKKRERERQQKNCIEQIGANLIGVALQAKWTHFEDIEIDLGAFT